MIFWLPNPCPIVLYLFLDCNQNKWFFYFWTHPFSSIYNLIFPFSAHNDEEEGLDGLELYKAIKHAKSHEVTEENEAADEENVLSTKRLIDPYYVTYSFPNSTNYQFSHEK